MSVIRYSTIVILLTSLVATPVRADTAAETSVKAAIVHKISKFVAWPDGAFESDEDPMRFCVAGDQQMLTAIQALSDQRVHGRLVVASAAVTPDDVIDACNVLYLGDDTEGDAQSWADAVAGRPVLTFGVTGGYGGDNSIVRVMVRRDKVRFEINLEANEGTGLRIGGQLLQLAAAVGCRGG